MIVAVTTAAEAFLSVHLPPPFVLRPLRNGQVNTTWQVVANEQQYFLKYQGEGQHNGIERSQEAHLQRTLAQNNLSPRVIATSPDYRWVLHEWVEAPTVSGLNDEDEQSRILALTLWRIHQQRPKLSRWSLKHRIANYLTAVGCYDDKLAKQQQHNIEAYQDLIELWDSHQAVFCHNDLSADHVLLSTPNRVVDWEYAGYGHACFDIASCIEINQLSEGAQQNLCRVYGEVSGQPHQSQELVKQLQRWRGLLQVINSLWLHAQHVQHR